MRQLVWWMLVGVVWVAALWRVPALPGPWGAPDGLLLMLLAWAFAPRAPRPSWGPFGLGACVGTLKDVASSGPMGSWLLVFAVTAWLATRIAGIIARDHPFSQLLWVGLFASSTLVVYAALVGLRGEWSLAGSLLVYFWMPSTVTTALASLAVFPLLRRLRVVE